MQHMRAQGEFTGGQAPYGFRVEHGEDRLVPVEAEQVTVSLVKQLRADGVSIRGVVSRGGSRCSIQPPGGSSPTARRGMMPHNWKAGERDMGSVDDPPGWKTPIWRCSNCGAEETRSSDPSRQTPPSPDAIVKVMIGGVTGGRTVANLIDGHVVVGLVKRRARAKRFRYFTCEEYVVETVHDL